MMGCSIVLNDLIASILRLQLHISGFGGWNPDKILEIWPAWWFAKLFAVMCLPDRRYLYQVNKPVDPRV
jgi:hypothetical protein